VTAHNLSSVNFLTALYEHCDPAWLSLFTIDRELAQNSVHWFRTDDRVDVAEFAAAHADRCIWFGVATRRAHLGYERGGATDCLQVPALWLDLDVHDPIRHKTEQPKPGREPKVLPPDRDAARELLADHPVAPTCVVDTGGGLQAWWILDEPLDAEHAQPVLDQWRDTWQTLAARRGWHVDNVFDVPRIMRLPGSRNTKRAD
jgi:putative DNA primase/helicase